MRTLHGRFFVLVAALVCANGALAFLLLARTLRTYELAMTQALNAGVAQSLARELTGRGANGRLPADLRPELRRLMAINPAAEIYLLDRGGRVEAASVPPDRIQRQHVELAPIAALIAGTSTLPTIDDDPLVDSGQRIFSAARIDAADPESGFVYVILGGPEAQTTADRIRSALLLRTVAILVGLGLIVGLLVAFAVMLWLSRKLRRLAMAIDEFGAGQFSDPKPVRVAAAPGGDELDRLGRAYNDMIAHIGAQMDRIAKSQIARQQLIANVSHDLRAPLKALRGHLDLLLAQEGALTPEKRRASLEVATRQARLMDRLTAELFDLATLRELERPPRLEALHISELVQDVVQKFGPIAKERGIALRTSLLPDAPMLLGDIALLERLLDNLLENALRFTPAGGAVGLRVARAEGGIVLEVADNGPGIPRQDLAVIFERSHRASAPLHPGDHGAGLGLAIAKTIVELHRGTISVVSHQQVGTTFRVELPVSPP